MPEVAELIARAKELLAETEEGVENAVSVDVTQLAVAVHRLELFAEHVAGREKVAKTPPKVAKAKAAEPEPEKPAAPASAAKQEPVAEQAVKDPTAKNEKPGRSAA